MASIASLNHAIDSIFCQLSAIFVIQHTAKSTTGNFLLTINKERAIFKKKLFFYKSVTSHSCSKYEAPLTNRDSVTFNSPVNAFTCSLTECQSKDVIEFRCEFCSLNFCMKHRLQIDHVCSRLSKPAEDTSKKEVKEFKFEMKQNVSEKNAGLAAKLVLMKLKQAAVGPPGLPEEGKFYCFVNYADQLKKPFFFSLKWPVGRCIDFLFDKLNINKSNLTTMKLWLDSSQIDSSLTVEEFIKSSNVKPTAVLDLKSIN